MNPNVRAVLLFPGQGGQRPGMCRGISCLGRSALDALGSELLERCVSAGPLELRYTEVQQPAVTLAALSCARALQAAGVEVVAVAGHSVGEFAAMAVADCWDDPNCLKIVRQRGQLMARAARAVAGGMLAIAGSDWTTIETTLRKSGVRLELACVNGSASYVLSGPLAELASFEQAWVRDGHRRPRRVDVEGAWHSRLLKQASEEFSKVLDGVQLRQGRVPFYSAVSGARVCSASELKRLAQRQMCSPVRWDRVIERVVAEHPGTPIVAVGPAKPIWATLRGVVANGQSMLVEDARRAPEAFQRLSRLPEASGSVGFAGSWVTGSGERLECG